MRGFTLIEFMVTLAVASLLIFVAVPGFYSVMQNNRVVTASNKMVATFHYARGEAVRRGVPVIVCASAGAALNSCSANSVDWRNGWIVFADADGDTAINSADDILRVSENLDTNTAVAADRSSVTYTSTGFLSGVAFSTRISASKCYGNNAREISISATGRIAVSRINCS